MSADHWFSLNDVEPGRAAMLLCQHDPNSETLEQAKQCTNDVTGPQDLLRLLQRFEDLAKCEPQHRPLLEWLHVARAWEVRYHPWIDQYVEAARLDVEGATGAKRVPKAIASGTPPPLNTPEVADAFEGINDQSAKQWRDKLGDVNNHQWLLTARAAQGIAPKASTWWPLEFAALLEKRGASFESLNRAFLNAPTLKPWLPSWQEARRDRNALGQ